MPQAKSRLYSSSICWLNSASGYYGLSWLYIPAYSVSMELFLIDLWIYDKIKVNFGCASALFSTQLRAIDVFNCSKAG